MKAKKEPTLEEIGKLGLARLKKELRHPSKDRRTQATYIRTALAAAKLINRTRNDAQPDAGPIPMPPTVRKMLGKTLKEQHPELSEEDIARELDELASMSHEERRRLHEEQRDREQAKREEYAKQHPCIYVSSDPSPEETAPCQPRQPEQQEDTVLSKPDDAAALREALIANYLQICPEVCPREAARQIDKLMAENPQLMSPIKVQDRRESFTALPGASTL